MTPSLRAGVARRGRITIGSKHEGRDELSSARWLRQEPLDERTIGGHFLNSRVAADSHLMGAIRQEGS